MQLIRGTYNINKQHRGYVMTIGNFDGVHLGHQALLKILLQEGQKRNLPILVMIFEPQPLEIFNNHNIPIRLTSLREKLKYLEQAGINNVLCVNFNKIFASQSAEHFIKKILVKKLNIKCLVIGSDFKFGANCQGNLCLLQTLGYKYNFDIIIAKTFYKNNQRISSTLIRNAVKNCNLLLAQELLGRQFSISGRVIYGDKRGRQLGFPTANISIKSNLQIQGVFIVKVHGVISNPILGIANIGKRPTFQGINNQLEVHLIDLNINFYGRYIEVVLLKKIRNEKHFSSISLLKKQILKDIIITKNFFKVQQNIKLISNLSK